MIRQEGAVESIVGGTLLCCLDMQSLTRRRSPAVSVESCFVQTEVGSVVAWHGDEGWGVLRSAAVESDVFAHFSDLVMDGYRSLEPGQLVRFECEHFPSGQDGYVYRASNVRLVD